MTFPDDLHKLRQEELADAMAYFKNITPPGHKEYETPVGEWPTGTSPPAGGTSPSSGLTVAYSTLTDRPRPMVHIVLIPTDDPTTIPAHMRWGNWNECPPPAYHVAALRAWRDRYGAELVGLGADTINLRVSRKPATREEALELARVQYAYCCDIIDQGVRSYRALAASLMAHDWWFFWWD